MVVLEQQEGWVADGKSWRTLQGGSCGVSVGVVLCTFLEDSNGGRAGLLGVASSVSDNSAHFWVWKDTVLRRL